MQDNARYNPIAVDVKGVMQMFGVSKNTAMQIGKDAGAVVHLGIKRTLYNVSKLQEYANSKTS